MTLRTFLGLGRNDAAREAWVKARLAALPAGSSLLDAGAGAGRYRRYCGHLRYTSQDFGQYDGVGDGKGLHSGTIDYAPIDIVSDIAAIPVPDGSFDAVLCTEVLEHVPDPVRVIHELARILRSGGKLILTAPFASYTHIAPYFYATGFSRYWYEHHLAAAGLTIDELTSNGDWYDVLQQEVGRLPSLTRSRATRALIRPVATAAMIALGVRRALGAPPTTSDLACFGWHCVATRR
ncbi:MAG: class I SAM-dependent methyltransferase [Sandaracinaceae bacterium]